MGTESYPAEEDTMPKPFPGMDPYLEGYLWSDVHHRLATEISRQLMPRLRPKYVARIEVRVVHDETPEAEIGIMYPDVEIVTTPPKKGGPSPRFATGGGVLVAPELVLTPAPVTISLPQIRIKSVEIRDTAHNQLITSIEILSPVYKRDPGLIDYRQKRLRLRQAAVHLLEIDLLRRGRRLLTHPNIPKRSYLVTLIRGAGNVAKAWPIKLQDKLPVVPVPLHHPDPEVPLDLDAVLSAIYDEAAYDLSIDYTLPPPPPSLTAEEEEWLDKQLKSGGMIPSESKV